MAPGTITLTVVSGAFSGLVGVFDVKTKITVGRYQRNKFTIKSDTVSSKHAIITHEKGQWFIEDCDSSNGTSVNGDKVVPGTPVQLKDGDMVLIGGGSDNMVRVNIETIEEVDLQVQKDVQKVKEPVLFTSKRRLDRDPGQNVTVKQLVEGQKRRVAEMNDVLLQGIFKDIAEDLEELRQKGWCCFELCAVENSAH
ncbi:hypothetical protein R1sor_022188 [Riccia sorocarpa]|uniref:FHA domain-containing protein n=1 Tax=Riccia sorocarpa TaxID=122646 RepID=A0ABD3GJ45_9MARC